MPKTRESHTESHSVAETYALNPAGARSRRVFRFPTQIRQAAHPMAHSDAKTPRAAKTGRNDYRQRRRCDACAELRKLLKDDIVARRMTAAAMTTVRGAVTMAAKLRLVRS